MQKMKTLTILIFMLVHCLSLGQDKASYIEYHKQCRLAEQYFLQDSLHKCFETYNNVFEAYDMLFPRDCFMASQMAHKQQKDSLAVEYILKAIPLGLNPLFFTEDSSQTNAPKLNQLKKSKYWHKVSLQHDSLYQIYSKRVDWPLKNKLMSMVRIDQDSRAKNNKWFNRFFRKGLEKDFDRLNHEDINVLDSVFKIKGYPGPWLIGIGDSLHYQTEYASFNNANLSGLIDIILYHNDSVFIKYGDFLFKEIEYGHIHPRTYAMIRDFRDRHLVKKDENQKMYYNIWWKRENFTDEEFSQHCYDIGCPTKQHLRNLYQKLGKGYDVFFYPFR